MVGTREVRSPEVEGAGGEEVTASQVSQSMRDLYLRDFEEAVEKATKPQPLVRSQSVCEYCTRPNLSNSETCKGCGAPASNISPNDALAAYGTRRKLDTLFGDFWLTRSLVNWRT